MSRYLTNLAERKRWWEIPVAILSVFLGVMTVETWIEDSPEDESFIIWCLAYAVVTALMLLPLYRIIRWHIRQRQAKTIAGRLAGIREKAVPLAELDRWLGMKNAAGIVRNLQKMGFLQRIDMDETSLLLDNPEPEKAGRAEEQGDVIQMIRALNDEIDDEVVSQRIERIEHVTASILKTLRERPEKAKDARRFMNYYLPTTLKLLENYRLMEKQSFQGENIRTSRRKIEGILEEIVVAAEKQQDRLFSAEAMDVEAEISVLENMMAMDGLTENGTFQQRHGI
ncbi:MAG: 5-bromo-4-chloroindolyl phosphate hydrolysis family protein [Clostridia bacterium]|nr:5-bromo-4-chloroindolyl phosphate hydrolysis family protein [Clostridia bacterium]